MKVRLKKGFHMKTKPNIIFDEIEKAKIDGNINQQALVDNAKPKNAPLHAEFEWNNPKAANAWRIAQARKLIQCLEVIHKEGPPTRAFESITVTEVGKNAKPGEVKVFRRIDDIMADPVARDDLLAQAIKDAASWRRRYAGLQELAQVFAAIDAVVLKDTG